MADEPVRIDVKQLQPGLYVSLGLRWMDHPFLFSSFRISRPEQVEKLRALGLRNIVYHPARSTVRPLPLPPEPEAQPRRSETERVPASVAAKPQTRRASARAGAEPQVAPEVEAYREVINRCEKDYRAAASTIRDLMQQALVSPEQASKKADALVEASMSGLMANRNALLNLICGTAWDGSARYHALNVMNLSVLLGRAAGLRGEALKSLGLGALLHDIGKLQLPPWVLRIAPQSRNRHEESAYRRHVELGVEMCARLGISEAVALDAVRCHHERIDGSGFPEGLVGEAMPLSARVVAIANRYDELVHGSEHASVGSADVEGESLFRIFIHNRAGLIETTDGEEGFGGVVLGGHAIQVEGVFGIRLHEDVLGIPGTIGFRLGIWLSDAGFGCLG